MTQLSLLLAAAGPTTPDLDAAGLDRLFDGRRPRPGLTAVASSAPSPLPPGRDYIIRAEEDPLPAAPRYALNLPAIPTQLRHTVPGFEKLFHRNQEETPEQVERMNALIQKKSKSWGGPRQWTYDGRPNEPPWTCLAYAAATANDWWALQLGRTLPSYTSPTHGGTETGLDPRLLETEYYRRSRLSEDYDPDFFVPPAFIQKDPVRNIGFPYEPRGFAKLLIEDKRYEVKDPITDEIYKWDPSHSAMEGSWRQVFSNNILRSGTPPRYARRLARAIEKWGIAYVQLEHAKHPRWPGAHAVAAVGYFCLEEHSRLIDCTSNKSDEDWGRTTFFIVHDSFGNFPADKIRAADGASAYRAVRVTSIDQAIVFPHGLDVRASPHPSLPGIWRISITNRGGQPVTVLSARAKSKKGRDIPVQIDSDASLFIASSPDEKMTLTIEAKHYYGTNGKGRSFSLTLDPAARTSGLPLEPL